MYVPQGGSGMNHELLLGLRLSRHAHAPTSAPLVAYLSFWIVRPTTSACQVTYILLAYGGLIADQREANEQFLERDGMPQQALLDEILPERVQHVAVGLQSVGPGIGTEYLGHLVKVGMEPRQCVAEAAAEAHLRQAPRLCFNERLVEALRDPRVLPIERLPDDQRVHDRENTCLTVVLPLDLPIIGEQACHARILAERH